MGLKRPLNDAQKAMQDRPLLDDQEFAMEFPNLLAFMNDVKYDDGSTRLPGSINAFMRFGVLTLALNDNDNRRTAYVNAPTWAEAWAMAEMAIVDDSTDWKTKPQSPPQQKPPF